MSYVTLIKRFDELSFSLSDTFDIEQCIRIGSQAKRREFLYSMKSVMLQHLKMSKRPSEDARWRKR